MIEFNNALTSHMKVFGRTITTTSYYSGGTIHLTPLDNSNPIEITYDVERDPTDYNRRVVKLLGSSFKMDKRTGQFRIDRAAGLVLVEEQRVLLQRKKNAEQEKLRESWRKRRAWANKLNNTLNNDDLESNLSVSVPWEEKLTHYNVNIKSEDEGTIMAIIDYLRDGGFVETKQIKKEDESKG